MLDAEVVELAESLVADDWAEEAEVGVAALVGSAAVEDAAGSVEEEVGDEAEGVVLDQQGQQKNDRVMEISVRRRKTTIR